MTMYGLNFTWLHPLPRYSEFEYLFKPIFGDLRDLWWHYRVDWTGGDDPFFDQLEWREGFGAASTLPALAPFILSDWGEIWGVSRPEHAEAFDACPLSPSVMERLVEVGFVNTDAIHWTIWTKRVELIEMLKEAHPDEWTPARTTFEGFCLRGWC